MTKSRRTGSGAKPSFNDLSNPWQRFRSQTDMGQIELARTLGVSQPTICGYEKPAYHSGHRFPSMKIAIAFIALAKKRRVRMGLNELFPEDKERSVQREAKSTNGSAA